MTPSKEEIKDRYDQLGSKLYDTRYTDEQKTKYEYISTHLGRGKTLDNGCGTGLFLHQLPDFSVGIDLSLELLKEARKRASDQQHLIQGDSEKLPFKDDVFDQMVSVTVIQNVPSPSIMITESARASKNGGNLVFSSLKRVYSEDSFRKLFNVDGIDVMKIYTTEEINDWIAVTRNTL